MVHLRSVLVTAALFSTTTAVSYSAFVSDTESISFALNIPQDANSNDLYFSLSGPSSCEWLAVGMGSANMKDSLIFMAYKDSSGRNVTLSPRLSYGNVEPSYTSNITIEILAGTSIDDDTTTVNAKCSNCRSWKGGSIDSTNTAAKFIWANGGVTRKLKSNSLNVGVKRHGSYGKFTMDLTKATGPGQAVTLANASTPGSIEISEKADHDFSSGAHACIMIFVFVGLMPLAVMILRILNSPKWHGVAQTLSAMLALIGMALGIKAGMMYNRTNKFNTAHQIIGLFVIAAMVGQFVLGFLHHRIYLKTKLPTKLGRVHIWLGRGVILAGTLNGFIGFPLAFNPKFDLALLALVLAVIVVSGPLFFWRWRRNFQKTKNADTVGEPSRGGYQNEPWRGEHAGGDVDLPQMNYPQPPPSYNNTYR